MTHTHDECGTEQDAEERPQSPFGRVETDSRGRNVWRWARGLADSTSVLLKKLSAPLELEVTQRIKARIANAEPRGKPGRRSAGAPPGGLALVDDGGRDAGGGFDPYNSR